MKRSGRSKRGSSIPSQTEVPQADRYPHDPLGVSTARPVGAYKEEDDISIPMPDSNFHRAPDAVFMWKAQKPKKGYQ